MDISRNRIVYIVAILGLVLWGGFNLQSHFEPFPQVKDKIYDVLLTIGVVTVLMERVLEMLLKIWRGTDKIILSTDLTKKKEWLTIVKEKYMKGELDKVIIALSGFRGLRFVIQSRKFGDQHPSHLILHDGYFSHRWLDQWRQ